MTESKYSTLKNAISELSKVYGNDPSVQAIMEIVTAIDRTEGMEEKETGLMDKNEWIGLGYTERIELKQTNPEQFNSAMAGNFKGGN